MRFHCFKGEQICQQCLGSRALNYVSIVLSFCSSRCSNGYCSIYYFIVMLCNLVCFGHDNGHDGLEKTVFEGIVAGKTGRVSTKTGERHHLIYSER